MSMIHGASNIGGMAGLQPASSVNAARGLTQGAESARATGTGAGSGLEAAMTSALARAGIPVTAAPQLAQAAIHAFMPTLLGALHPVAAGSHADMQGLLRQVAATAHANPALQQGFQSLMGSLGVPGNPAALSPFLQALAGNLQGASAVGSVVNTTV